MHLTNEYDSLRTVSTRLLTWQSRLSRSGTARRWTGAMLVLYSLAGFIVPVVHAQVEAGRRPTTHIEAQNTRCSAHDELSCSICRLTPPVVPVSRGVPTVAQSLCSTKVAFLPATPFIAETAPSILGARAPPLR